MLILLLKDSLSDNQLEAEVNRLIRDVNIKVLDQMIFGRDDTIVINNGIEILCDIFDGVTIYI